MAYSKVISCLVFLVVIVCLQSCADANPLRRILQRQKRVSDQRLAELETLIALSKMKGKLVTVPIAFGIVDPAKVGRRRRSVDTLLRSLAEDNSVEGDEGDSQSLTRSSEDERIEEDEILLNLLFNEELRKKHRPLPVRLPD